MATLPQHTSESFRKRNPHLQNIDTVNKIDLDEFVREPVELGVERDLHDQFISWLRVHEKGPIPFVHSRMDRKSTIREGWPDFTILYGGRTCCVEFKMPGKQLTEEQGNVQVELANAGIECGTFTEWTAAVLFVREKLNL